MQSPEGHCGIDSSHKPLPELDLNRYRPVDMMYNIGRIAGKPARGLDVIDLNNNERIYVTEPADYKAEDSIREQMGRTAILSSKQNTEDYSVYKVPIGTRLLVKTLEIAPYNPAYMSKLESRALRLLNDLSRLDSQRFGITIDDIAIAHNGTEDGPDDTYLTIVPPVKSGSLG